MTKPEIDGLIKILIKYKKQGQFRAFWSTFNESVNLMSSKEVVIESMWSPAVALLTAQNIPVRYAFPPEGMRGWCSCQAIPKHASKLTPSQYSTDVRRCSRPCGSYYVANGIILSWISHPRRAKASRRSRESTTSVQRQAGCQGSAWDHGHVGDIKKAPRATGIVHQRSHHVANSFSRRTSTRWLFNDFLSA
jgi:hypothetical protein